MWFVQMILTFFKTVKGEMMARCNSFERATAKAVEALQRQIEKRKTKLLTNRMAKNINYGIVLSTNF